MNWSTVIPARAPQDGRITIVPRRSTSVQCTHPVKMRPLALHCSITTPVLVWLVGLDTIAALKSTSVCPTRVRMVRPAMNCLTITPAPAWLVTRTTIVAL